MNEDIKLVNLESIGISFVIYKKKMYQFCPFLKPKYLFDKEQNHLYYAFNPKENAMLTQPQRSPFVQS
jgi:hypothetical protein